jgi:hypothetical protein
MSLGSFKRGETGLNPADCQPPAFSSLLNGRAKLPLSPNIRTQKSANITREINHLRRNPVGRDGMLPSLTLPVQCSPFRAPDRYQSGRTEFRTQTWEINHLRLALAINPKGIESFSPTVGPIPRGPTLGNVSPIVTTLKGLNSPPPTLNHFPSGPKRPSLQGTSRTQMPEINHLPRNPAIRGSTRVPRVRFGVSPKQSTALCVHTTRLSSPKSPNSVVALKFWFDWV